MAAALDLVAGPERAAAMLQPVRLRILEELRVPGSASSVARTLGVPRQKINYHLRELEKAGFLEEIEQRRNGNCMERIVRAKASHYLIDPELLGILGSDPAAIQDRFSSDYLLALAAEVIRDLAGTQREAGEKGKRVSTLSLQSEIRFATAGERHAFANELANAVAVLIAKYHDASASAGKTYNLMVGAWPRRRKEKERERS